MSTIEKINSAVKVKRLTPVKDAWLESLANKLDQIQNMKKLWRSEEGKILIQELRDNIASSLKRLLTFAKERPSIDEMMSCIHEYNSNMTLISKLTGVTNEEEIQRQIDETLKILYP